MTLGFLSYPKKRIIFLIKYVCCTRNFRLHNKLAELFIFDLCFMCNFSACLAFYIGNRTVLQLCSFFSYFLYKTLNFSEFILLASWMRFFSALLIEVSFPRSLALVVLVLIHTCIRLMGLQTSTR